MRSWIFVWVGLCLAVAEACGQGAQVAGCNGGRIDCAGKPCRRHFSGRVVEVDRNEDDGYVDVMFHVEHSVRGCSDGSTYVLREWAGLWIGEPARYHPGQRLLMLLAGRGASGMSAPVGGLAGVIPVVAGREPPLIHGKTPAPRDDAGIAATGEAVDLRWVQALAVRRTATGKIAAGESAMEISRWRGPVEPLPVVPKSPAAGPSLAAVLALLGQGIGR